VACLPLTAATQPENILLADASDLSSVKISDFGLAKMSGASRTCVRPR
jgi:hypothetical protein